MTRKITTYILTSVYLLLALASPFAVFHHHQLPLQELSKQGGHEWHDAQCDEHVTAHIHLSKHCAACQFTAAKQTDSSYIWNLFSNQPLTDFLFFHFSIPASQPHLSLAAGRAPPFFLS